MANSTGDINVVPSMGTRTVYEVKEGDSLESIAQQFYCSMSEWVRIRNANPSNNHFITPGLQLVIPQ